MCGLIGEWRWNELAIPLPLHPLAHRGPDGQGSWTSADGHCWLGHTRLAIQDLSPAGAQPIRSHCGRFTLVFNGEIYNHLSLRPDLGSVPWRGHSDSESLVEAMAIDGLKVLKDLQGMYAFAAYDNHKRQLWLGRDHLGIKPLYIARRDGTVRFASERRALGWQASLQPQQIAQVLSWGHLTTPVAPPDGASPCVVSLPPGALLRLCAEHPEEMSFESCVGHKPTSPILFRPLRQARIGLPGRTRAVTKVRSVLEQVVADHLIADVPVACFLSSGLDSGILASLACRVSPGRIRTFTVAFPKLALDESLLATQMANHIGSEHFNLTISEPEVIQWIEEGLQALDVPTVDGLNTYLISRAVSEQGIRVALSGLGADEFFGGYPSHRLVPWLQMLRMLPRGLRVALLHRLLPRLDRKLVDVEQWNIWNLTLALRRWASNEDLRLAGTECLRWPEPPCSLPRQRWAAISCAELYGYTEPMLLRDSDVLSMACGLEVRVPFLDQRLQALVWDLPTSSLRPGKTLLRQACVDLFPAGYLKRPKQCFTLPMADWMQGPLKGCCQKRLSALCHSGWLDSDWVRQQWHAFTIGKLNWPRAWALVVLGEFVGRDEPSSSAPAIA